MEIIIKALQFFLSLSMLVLVHEMGHYAMARLFKVRVEKFYIFFAPWFSLFKFRHGDTEYGMGWLPLGGFVKISGMVDESLDTESLKEPPKPHEFRSKPAWQRLLIMIGGVTVNLVFAFLLYIAILYAWGERYLPAENLKYGVVADTLFLGAGIQNGDVIVALDGKKVDDFATIVGTILLDEVNDVQLLRAGQPVTITLPPSFRKELLSSSSKSFKRKSYLAPRCLHTGEIAKFAQHSPARDAGLMENDKILSLDGETFTYADQTNLFIQSRRAQTLAARVLRGADTLSIAVPVGADGFMGIYWRLNDDFEYVSRDFTLLAAIPAGCQMAIERISGYLKQFKLFKDPEALKSMGGFISIGSIFPGQWHWPSFWEMTALLSIVLGIMNLLPIPAMDGGHVLFLLYEMVTRRKPSDQFLERAQVAGMIFILALLLLANGNDLVKWIAG
ncbi:MAG: RIP metalloprotease RseP [Odoribacteraceae bacterium]|jgi:regulator of sigma E protease|nr:RIP metalloprotease RseP [Odoribacteraceae bacterium]